MANLSPLNPLTYILQRQYRETDTIKNKIFKERLAKAKNLYRKDLLAHYGCVNAIEFSIEGDLLVSGGDDRRVLLWSIPESLYGKGKPATMKTNHISNIFCLAFDSGNTKIFSGGNDDQVIIHDAITGKLVGKLPHAKPVYGLSINPQADYILATAGDDGRILLYDVRESPDTEPLSLARQKTGFHSVMFSPTNPRWLATANSDEGIALWDCRRPNDLLIHYDSNAGSISGISACFNSAGTQVLALRRRLPPVLYNTQKDSAICQFYHPQYYNSCTMKTCCFAGDDDEYVLSGSDDFNLYIWKVAEDDSSEWGDFHLVLRDHRSIVNQVRYNKQNNLIASSGVEKMVKLWSSIPIGTWKGSLQKESNDNSRAVYSHEDYIYLVGQSGERISHDYSDQSTQEDAKMMAFFDSLIQREIEGWDSTSENSFSSESDSDGNERSVASLLNEMFVNGNKNLYDEIRKPNKPNRIAQLIAKKRSRLVRMAHEKASSSIQNHQLKKKKASSKSKSSKFKKHNGVNKKSSYNKANVPVERKQQHNKTTVSGSQQQQQQNGGSSGSSANVVNNSAKLRKYRTRQSIKEMSDSGASNNSFDAPSTSTGITSSSNSVYRVIEQDSDEDLPTMNDASNNNNNVNNEENFVNILPTPLNGTHDLYINVLEMTNSNNVVAIRNEDSYNGGGASTSSRCVSETACASTSRAVTAQRRGNNNGDNLSSESDSDFEYDYQTPVKKRRTVSASDSGCGTGACSSTSPYTIRRSSRNHQECSTNDLYNNNNNNSHNNNERSSDDEIIYEKINKRINRRMTKALVNLRKQIGVDSDSN